MSEQPAEAAVVDESPDAVFIDWQGERFQVADKIGGMPRMIFAKLASEGYDSTTVAGLAAMYDLLQQYLTPADWIRFQDHATEVKASDDEILSMVRLALEALSQRPTVRPSDSSDGPTSTKGRSTDDSSSRVINRLKDRPDLQRAVLHAQRNQATGLHAV